MKEGAREHHSYASYAPSTYGSYEPRRANPSAACSPLVRFFEQDPLAFSGGVRLVWRVGDLTNLHDPPDSGTGVRSPKCFIEHEGPGVTTAGTPAPTTVTSYTWVYTW
jgi:hypothetical protein